MHLKCYNENQQKFVLYQNAIKDWENKYSKLNSNSKCELKFSEGSLIMIIR